MKTIKKFWGVVFILALLSTLFIGAVPQAAADNYIWGTARALPDSSAGDTTLALYPNTTTPAEGFGITAVGQSGATIVCAATDNTSQAARFYKSSNGGITWTLITGNAALQPAAAANYTKIAVAPDDPSIIAAVGTMPATDGIRPQVVWVTKTGGATWYRLAALNANAWINDIAISPAVSGVHNITVCGNTAATTSANVSPTADAGYLVTYGLDSVSPAWTAPTGFGAGASFGPPDNVNAVAYSPNYLADYALLVVTNNVQLSVTPYTLGNVALHVYSYNTNLWDALVESSFPRVLESTATSANITACANATIVLDPNFFLGDQAAQIGFVGCSITNNVTAADIGGIYRLTYTSAGGANLLDRFSPARLTALPGTVPT